MQSDLTRRYDILFWDLDDTLLDFKQSEYHSLVDTMKEYHLAISQEEIHYYSVCNEELWKCLERGGCERDFVYLERFRKLFHQMGIGHLDPLAFHMAYARRLSEQVWYRDDSLSLCKRLSKDVRQYIVSNGSISVQEGKIQRSGFGDIMQGVFLSEDIGALKPSLIFFEECMRRIGQAERSRILIIGDSLTSDMRGGQNFGIDRAWYNPDEKEMDCVGVTFQYELKSLQQVEGIVWPDRKDKN